jgi:hypothetical protein
LIALGDCAVFGGVPAMRNAVTAAVALRRAYVETESTVDGMVPQHEDLAVMQEVRPLDQVGPGRHLSARLPAVGGRDLLRTERTGRRPPAQAARQIPGLALGARTVRASSFNGKPMVRQAAK